MNRTSITGRGDELFQCLGGRGGNMGVASFRFWTYWNGEGSTEDYIVLILKGKRRNHSQPRTQSPMPGPVGAATEKSRSGPENPHEDARASGGAGFLHDVLDVLFDRLFGNLECAGDFLVRIPSGQIT
jgi:hypothetical protein